MGLVPVANASEHRLFEPVLLGCVPAPSHRSEVCRGYTSITIRPASSALAHRISKKTPKPVKQNETLDAQAVIRASSSSRSNMGLPDFEVKCSHPTARS